MFLFSIIDCQKGFSTSFSKHCLLVLFFTLVLSTTNPEMIPRITFYPPQKMHTPKMRHDATP